MVVIVLAVGVRVVGGIIVAIVKGIRLRCMRIVRGGGLWGIV